MSDIDTTQIASTVVLCDEEQTTKPRTVVVTGVTGFLGSSLVERLLLGGHTVHGTCRGVDSDNAKALKALPGAAERLKLFKADLLSEGSFDAAMQGCDTVFHVASPVAFNVTEKDAQALLIEPAVKGTKNVLTSVNKCESITRVVLTSSISAIYGNVSKTKVYTEDDWNMDCSEKYLPYFMSKMLAERAAWEMANEQSRWTMAAMNPTVIFGISAINSVTEEVLDVVRRMLSGMMYPFAPPFTSGLVDVHDVCKAHVLAGIVKRDVTGRFILNHSCTPSMFLTLAEMLRPKFGKTYWMPKYNLSKKMRIVVKRVVAPILHIEGAVVDTHFGQNLKLDNTRAVEELGMTFQSPKAGAEDVAEYLFKTGGLKRK